MVGASLLVPAFAFADYTAFQNVSPPGQTLDSDYTMFGFSAGGGTMGFRYDATSTVTNLGTVVVPLCRYLGADGGSVFLEVRTTASTGPIVASSTLTNNSTNISTSGCTSSLLNATSSYFILNNRVQWVSGVQLYFIFRAVGTTGSFYLSLNGAGASDLGRYTWLVDGVPKVEIGEYWNVFASGVSSGLPPYSPPDYNASTTAVICSTFDVGCYISTAVSFLFYPSIPLSEQVAELASTTRGVSPFGYVFDFYDTIYTASQTATTTLSVSVELSGIMNWLGGNFATTTVTVLSGAGLRSTMGTSMWNFSQTLLSALLWVGFILYLYRRSIHLL